jgi:hypothetical protein
MAKQRTEKNRRSGTITAVWLPPEDREYLTRSAADAGMNLSQVLRRIVLRARTEGWAFGDARSRGAA